MGSDDLRLERDELRLESDDLRLERDGLRMESDDLRMESDDLRMESDDLRMESDDLRLERDDLRMESDDLRLESDDLRLESDDLRLESDDLRLESDDLRLESDDIRMGRDDHRVGSDHLRMESDDLRVESDNLRMGTGDLDAGSDAQTLLERATSNQRVRMRVDVRSARAPRRCALCHDELEVERLQCLGCSATYHMGCVARCVTIGCESALQDLPERRVPSDDLAGSIAATVVGAVLVLATVWSAFSWKVSLGTFLVLLLETVAYCVLIPLLFRLKAREATSPRAGG